MTNANITAAIARIERDLAAIKREASRGDRDSRVARHPAEPMGTDVLVKVSFTGDRDGNTFAVCLPTSESKRIKDGRGGRVSKRMWKYTYETATGSSPTLRSWGGLLKTLDGHGRTVTKIEVTSNGHTRNVYTHSA